MLTLTYMPADHVPVLAAELIDLLDPQPGRDGRRLHLRRRRPRAPGRRAHRARRRARLHRPRPRGRGALRGVRDRGAVRRPASSAATTPTRSPSSRDEGLEPDVDLLRPRRLLDADRRLGARLLLRLRRAARHADGPRRPADRGRPRQRVARAPARRDPARATARSATRAGSPPRSSAAGRSRRPPSWSRRSATRCPPSARFGRGHPGEAHLPGAPDRAQRGARLARPRPAGSPGSLLAPRRPAGRDLLPLARGPPGEALHRRPRPGLHLPAGAARSACAATSPRRSRSRGARSRPARASSRPTHVRARRTCAAPAS